MSINAAAAVGNQPQLEDEEWRSSDEDEGDDIGIYADGQFSTFSSELDDYQRAEVLGDLPARLPGNLHRKQLWDDFKNMEDQILPLFGQSSYAEPDSGYERAWFILMGANIEGNIFYLCHITSGFSTVRVYNGGDSNPECPGLISGKPLHCKKEIMDLIRNPDQHSNLPKQGAFAIIPNRGASAKGIIEELLNQTKPTISTTNYDVSLLKAHGSESLSFKNENFPLEFWTHESRSQVVKTALALKIRELEQATHPSAQEELKKIIRILTEANSIENEISAFSRDLDVLNRRFSDNNKECDKKKDKQRDIESNPKIPSSRKDEILEKIRKEIEVLNKKKDRFTAFLENRKEAYSSAIKKKEVFIEENLHSLPNSYREATFQIALDVTLPYGNKICKRYNNQGEFVTSLVENPHDISHIRFSDEVHLPYDQSLSAAVLSLVKDSE